MVLVLSTAAFSYLNARLNIIFGYPDSEGTQTYADPIPNPDDALLVAMTIQDRCLPYLTTEETNHLVHESVIQSWFRGPHV